MFVMANMLVLFGNFYLKAYASKTSAAAPKKPPTTTTRAPSTRRTRSRKVD